MKRIKAIPVVICPQCNKNMVLHEHLQLIKCFVRHNVDSDKGSTLLPKIVSQLKKETHNPRELVKLNHSTDGAISKILKKLRRFNLINEEKAWDYDSPKAKKPSNYVTLSGFGRYVYGENKK